MAKTKATHERATPKKLKGDRAQLHARIPQTVWDRTTAMAALYGIDRDQFVSECLDKATERLKEIQDELRRERADKEKQGGSDAPSPQSRV